jgi:hypothetical protein
MAWRVVGVRGVEATPGSDAMLAAVVDIEQDHHRRHILVELTETARVTGKTLNARAVVQEFLGWDEPRKRLKVSMGGVSVAE